MSTTWEEVYYATVYYFNVLPLYKISGCIPPYASLLLPFGYKISQHLSVYINLNSHLAWLSNHLLSLEQGAIKLL